MPRFLPFVRLERIITITVCRPQASCPEVGFRKSRIGRQSDACENGKGFAPLPAAREFNGFVDAELWSECGKGSKRLTENELSDFSRLWHDGCGKTIIEAQDVDQNHSAQV